MTITRWTARDDARLLKLSAEGLNARLIAERLHISRNAVIGRLWRVRGKRLVNPVPLEPPPPRIVPAAAPVAAAPTLATTQVKAPERKRKRFGVALMDIGAHDCRWPLWKSDGVQKLFCGQHTGNGQTYCPHHRLVSERGEKMAERP